MNGKSDYLSLKKMATGKCQVKEIFMSVTNARVEANESRWIFAPKVYDFLKDASQIYIPALGVAYAGLAAIWHWGFVLEVSGTVLVIDVFLGTVLKISKTVYDNSDKSKDGTIGVSSSGVVDVTLDPSLSELTANDRVVLEVAPKPNGTDPRLLDDSQN